MHFADNPSEAIVQVVDFYLDDSRAEERAQIVKLVHRDDDEALSLLQGYIREAQSKFFLAGKPVLPS